MAAISNSSWKAVLAVAGLILVVFLLVSGYLFWGIAVVVLLIVFGGGAMLYRTMGPPDR